MSISMGTTPTRHLHRALLVLALATISCSALSVSAIRKDPLVGRWREVAWFDCQSGEEVASQDPIGEVMFKSNGTVTVTWIPIETYVDYRGAYARSEDGSIEIAITWSAYAPSDFDGVGKYAIDRSGNLLLTEMWLGSPKNTQGMNGCGHRLERLD
jgi:hypothetical protein